MIYLNFTGLPSIKQSWDHQYQKEILHPQPENLKELVDKNSSIVFIEFKKLVKENRSMMHRRTCTVPDGIHHSNKNQGTGMSIENKNLSLKCINKELNCSIYNKTSQ